MTCHDARVVMPQNTSLPSCAFLRVAPEAEGRLPACCGATPSLPNPLDATCSERAAGPSRSTFRSDARLGSCCCAVLHQHSSLFGSASAACIHRVDKGPDRPCAFCRVKPIRTLWPQLDGNDWDQSVRADGQDLARSQPWQESLKHAAPPSDTPWLLQCRTTVAAAIFMQTPLPLQLLCTVAASERAAKAQCSLHRRPTGCYVARVGRLRQKVPRPSRLSQ